jgi:hypothetical protein
MVLINHIPMVSFSLSWEYPVSCMLMEKKHPNGVLLSDILELMVREACPDFPPVRFLARDGEKIRNIYVAVMSSEHDRQIKDFLIRTLLERNKIKIDTAKKRAKNIRVHKLTDIYLQIYYIELLDYFQRRKKYLISDINNVKHIWLIRKPSVRNVLETVIALYPHNDGKTRTTNKSSRPNPIRRKSKSQYDLWSTGFSLL